MFGDISRRRFLSGAGEAALGAAMVATAACSSDRAAVETLAPQPGHDGEPRLQKALLWSMLPEAMSIGDRFKLAADLGFQGVEVKTTDDDGMLESLRAGADRAGVRIHSVMNSGSWTAPLSSGDDAVVGQGLELLRRSLRQARLLGADAVLMIPAVVTPDVRYKEAWERSQRHLRGVLAEARELRVVIAIENVGNRFLLSPLEFARYVDEMNDPFLRAYFDIGNSLCLWGYPQDWILTLDRRIRKIHLKDYDFGRKRFVPLRDGDVDWPAVRRALASIRFSGFLTVEPNYRIAESEKGDRAYLEEVARRVDLILEGE